MAENIQKESIKKKGRWWRWLLYLLLLLILIPIILFFLLQLSPVQNVLVDYIEDRISQSIDGEVIIDKVDIDINEGFQLEGFRLLNVDSDTILSAASLDVGLQQSLYSLRDNSIAIDKVKLSSPYVKIVTKKGESQSNLDQILSSLKSPKTSDKKGEPFNLDIKNLIVSNMSLSIINENKNQEQTFNIEEGEISINTFLKDNLLDIAKIRVSKPYVKIVKRGDATEITTSKGSSEEVNAEDIIDAVETESSGLRILIGSLEIAGGLFSLNDYNKEPLSSADVLDKNHFEISDIDLVASDIELKDKLDINFDLDKLDFIDDKGFEVRSLTSKNISINDKQILFPNFKFVTDRTNLSRSISFKFDSFDDFADFERQVVIDASFSPSRVYLGDIMHFVKKLGKSDFFIQNKNKTVDLSGELNGTVDNLQGQSMNIGVGDELMMEASFTTRKITSKGAEFLDFRIKNLVTDMNFMKSFIPGFTPPENFYKLQDINFNGSFYGYLKDFVVFGSLKSVLGDAFLDIRMDIKDGSSLAKYSGELSLEQFELGKWTDNDDFGIVDFSASITDGKGLTLNSVYSDLYATVESLTFKDYEYKDFVMDAQVDKNTFNGEFSISDENIDFVFDGQIEIKDSIPYLDFKANIEKIDFSKLNLTKDSLSIRGNVDIKGYGKDINDVVGNMIASDLEVMANDTIYSLDTISLTVFESGYQNREIKLYSDIAQVELEGEYDLATIIPSAKHLLKKNYPHFTQNWDNKNYVNNKIQDLRFDITIVDSRNFLELVGVRDIETKNFKAKGSLDTRKGDLSFASSVPYLGIQSNSFWDTQLLISSDNNSGDILVNIDSTVIGANSFNPIDIQSKMNGDTVNFLVSTADIVDSLESIDIQGRLIPHPRGYEVNITDNQIEALGSVWSFEKSNKIIVGNGYHNIDNLRISDGTRSITIDDVFNKGIALYLADFNFLTINGLINYDKMEFAGKGDVSLLVDDVYEDKNFEANIYIDDFTINDDSFGSLEIDVSKDKNGPANVLMSLGNTEQQLLLNGTLDPELNNYVNAQVESKNFPLSIFEYLLADGIKNTFGGLDLKARIKGPAKDLKIEGRGNLDGGVTVIYTGVGYTFENQTFNFTENNIDLTGAQILDPERGIGYIDGGMNHSLFRDFTLDATISGTDVVALNTTKYENPLYYGYGKGDMSVKFTGPFHLVNMKIDATAKEGSVLNIPISEGVTLSDENFITFIKKEELFAEKDTEEEPFRFEGIDIEIDLTMTPLARVNIIFDESRGDIIQGNGRGNMKMNITRYGDFDMYGTYEIESGEYLFTALGAVAKPFQVRRGGQIRWTGDPINATLDIVADYEVRTSLELFLADFVLQGSTLESASRSKTQVELILNLGGTLFKPRVNFDLDFPDVQGELRSTVQSKMRTLQANQAELNSQVLGLIVFNSFLPSTSNSIAIGSSEIRNTGIGTLSEFVSSQASLLFTGLLNEVFADNGLISGIDFDIGLRKNSFNGVQNTNGIAPDEIEVNLKNRFKFLDERLSLDVGGNYVWDNVLNGTAIGNYFIGNFVLEYFLTDDRKLKLRMYGRYDYDEIVASRRQKYGLGVGYRTEFGTLLDFKQTMAKKFRVMNNEDEDSIIQE